MKAETLVKANRLRDEIDRIRKIVIAIDNKNSQIDINLHDISLIGNVVTLHEFYNNNREIVGKIRSYYANLLQTKLKEFEEL